MNQTVIYGEDSKKDSVRTNAVIDDGLYSDTQGEHNPLGVFVFTGCGIE